MYCYVTMPFGLRNAGATYQRCMLHVFGDHLGRSVEAYVDDIIVKSRKADDLVADLRIAFDCLRAKGVKLNPEKCVFGVPRGMLLGFIVSQRGIEPSPDKVSAITRMGPIYYIDVARLGGWPNNYRLMHARLQRWASA